MDQGQHNYPGYGTFMLEQRNGQPQDPRPYWRITAGAPGECMEDPAYPTGRTRHATLQDAVAEIRTRLEEERRYLLERAEGCRKQLERLDAMYAPKRTPGQAIRAQRDRLVECLRSFGRGEPPGRVVFDGFSISLPYLHSDNIFVVDLPEYEAINLRFLPSDIELLKDIVREAGFGDAPSWNGLGCFTVSFRLTRSKAASKEETAGVAA